MKKYVADDEKTSMCVSVDVATKKRIKKIAKANHVTVSGLISAWVWSQDIPKKDDEEDEDDE